MEPQHHHYRPPTEDPRHPPPPPGQWYPPPPPPPQFQYHPQPYPAPPRQQPYPAHPHTNYTYRPNLPPHPYPPPPPPHQDWGNTNWGHHPGWEYPARQDEEDWAAKAKAWAANKSVNDNQHPQSQFTPVSRLEGQSPYQDPYQQNVESHYADVQSSNPSPGYHQYPAPGPSSFVPDEHVAYGAKDGRFGGDSNAVYHHQESSSVSSLVHMQEVPSSYSSIAGNVEIGDGNEKSYKSYPYPTDSSQVPFHDHLPPPPVGRPVLMEQPHYGVRNHAAEPPIDLSDQPLSFTRRSSFDQIQQNYNNNDPGRPVRGVDHVTPALSHYSLTSAHLSGTVYPPFPPVLPSAQQHGPSSVLNSSFPGNSTPPFGMMSGPSFQSSISAMGVGATSGLHPTTVFPGDIYGVLSGSDRPKKAPVPDWLKEEIIKNKAIIASSAPERPADSIEDETFDKTPGRADQEDSQSIGSPSSAVEEDEEDNMEAVRTAEVNQEIKKILTEVLLKVTDELFDEIATQVLEEDLTTHVAQETVAPDRKPSFAIPAVPTSTTSAKVLIAAKAWEVDTEDESGKNTSSSPGDLLGLASYASDDDDDDDDADKKVQHQPSKKKNSENDYAAENGNVEAKFGSDNKSQVHENNYERELVSNGATIHHNATGNVSNEVGTSGRAFDGNGRPKSTSNAVSELAADEHNFEVMKTVETPGTSKPKNSVGEKVYKTEKNQDVSVKLSAADDSRDGEPRNKQVNKDDDVGETKSSYVGRDIVKAGDAGKNRKGGKEDESLRRHDERYGKSERTTDKNIVSKERTKEQGGKSVEKVKETDPRKRSGDPSSGKEKERDRRGNDKDDSDRRRERKKDEKEDRSRDKHRSESSRHRRRRSPSAGSRGRSGKANCSSDELSDDSKRKLHTKKRNLSRSPSPSRSRKRQDSRSPSKRSHRRHSPFSSLETTRKRRSRSRSPRRQR